MAARRAARSLRPHRMKERSQWPPRAPTPSTEQVLYAPAASTTEAGEVRGGRSGASCASRWAGSSCGRSSTSCSRSASRPAATPRPGSPTASATPRGSTAARPTDGFLKFGLHTKEPFTGLLRGPGRQHVHRVGLHALDGRHRHRAAARHRHPPGRGRRHRLDGAVLHRLGALAREQPVPRRPRRLRDRPLRHRRRRRGPLPRPRPPLGAASASSRSTRSSAERSGRGGARLPPAPPHTTRPLRGPRRRSGGLRTPARGRPDGASRAAGVRSGHARTSHPHRAQPGDRRRRDAPRRHLLRPGRAPDHRRRDDGRPRGSTPPSCSARGATGRSSSATST